MIGSVSNCRTDLGVQVVIVLVEVPDDAVVAIGQAVLSDEPLAPAVASAQSQYARHLPRRTKVKL